MVGVDLRGYQSHQKSHVGPKRREMRFEANDHIFLRVTPTQGIIRFGIKDKLTPKSIRSFELKGLEMSHIT